MNLGRTRIGTDARVRRYHIGRHVNNLQVANTYVSPSMNLEDKC